MTVNYSIRLDENLKKQSFAVIEEYGLTPAQVIKMFFRQIAETRAIPVSLKYKSNEPNEETKQAMREVEQGVNDCYTVNSVEELNAIVEKIRNE
ncbi:MAG: type II toxin-antitoxin system RelB/DinJ family antitoxin [Neisseriaceae bacterium]|nr:type II toxin-antitoxin system RelB/DinJ family antitoxin [Neisseriaceae bacterium]